MVRNEESSLVADARTALQRSKDKTEEEEYWLGVATSTALVSIAESLDALSRSGIDVSGQ